jgi:RNA polymerase sigma-70 factor, ECF subfamily
MVDWPTIVQQYSRMVWRTAGRLLNDRAEAEDIHQATFLSAVKWAQTKPIRHWRAFLKKVATRKALDRLRQRQRGPICRETLPEGGTDGVDLAHEGETSDLPAYLRAALAELNARQANAFCLRHLEGLSRQDIADQLRTTPNNVGVLLRRAQLFLQDWLRANWPGAERYRVEEMP